MRAVALSNYSTKSPFEIKEIIQKFCFLYGVKITRATLEKLIFRADNLPARKLLLVT